MSEQPRVGVVMGSDSDWGVMQAAVDILKRLGIAHEARVVSAHRTPVPMPALTSKVPIACWIASRMYIRCF